MVALTLGVGRSTQHFTAGKAHSEDQSSILDAQQLNEEEDVYEQDTSMSMVNLPTRTSTQLLLSLFDDAVFRKSCEA